jgi:hypothetical protein
MSKLPGWPLCPKGDAMALHLTPEYEEGKRSWRVEYGGPGNSNPYDFWDEYTKYYAWDIGRQEGKWPKQ